MDNREMFIVGGQPREMYKGGWVINNEGRVHGSRIDSFDVLMRGGSLTQALSMRETYFFYCFWFIGREVVIRDTPFSRILSGCNRVDSASN